MKKKFVLLAILGVVIILILLICYSKSVQHKKANMGFIPKEGFVPDAETAIKIAEAVWMPIYGDEVLQEKPFQVTYFKATDCWYVTGTFPENTDGVIRVGGVAEIMISKSNGEILYVSHGK